MCDDLLSCHAPSLPSVPYLSKQSNKMLLIKLIVVLVALIGVTSAKTPEPTEKLLISTNENQLVTGGIYFVLVFLKQLAVLAMV